MTEEEFREADSADLLAALESAHAIGIPVETDEQRMVWFGFFLMTEELDTGFHLHIRK